MLTLTVYIRKIISSFRKQKNSFGLGQVDINTERLKTDFDVLDRYINFSSELLRLSLLGIGALAFLLKEMMAAPKSGEVNPYIKLISTNPIIKTRLSWSIIFFAAASACALAHRYYSSDAMAYHIRYIRLATVSRSGKSMPSDDQEAPIEKEKTSEKDKRDAGLFLSSILLALSTISLALGTIFLAIAIYIALA